MEFLERFCLIQDKRDLLAGEIFDSKQVLQTLQHVFPLMPFGPGLQKDCRFLQETRSTSMTRSSPSISFSRTSTISESLVSTVRPTKEASIGISRWPRSINTQRRIRFGRP